MAFSEDLFAGRFPVALEITPPQRPLPKVLLRRAALLGDVATAINVIQRPGRQSSLDASCELLRAGLDPAWHLVTRGRTRVELEADLAVAREAGLAQVLCIRGDHEAGDGPDAVTIREAIGLVGAALPGALVGATLNQHARDPVAAMRNLMPKLRAGARYVQTQPTFDIEALRPFAERVRGEAGARVVAMVMPLLSAEAVEKIEARLGFRLPGAIAERVAAGGEGGWDVFEQLLDQIAHCGWVDGVAVMTFEMDPPPAAGERIAVALRRTLGR